MSQVIIGNRRFTCLSPTLVRVEFSPEGKFDDRRSVMAYPKQQPQAFTSVTRVEEDGSWDVLSTSAIEIRTSRNTTACDRISLELRWSDGRLRQLWRPDDRDYHNLGGTLRSLDRYSGKSCALDGVHMASMESPDVTGTAWPAWMYCEVDPVLAPLHPAPPEKLNQPDWLSTTSIGNDNVNGLFLEHTYNWYKECRKFCPGVLSRSGYFFLNDSATAVLDEDDFPVERLKPGYQDWYFFAYGSDYEQALKDFHRLSGPAALPRHKSIGIIFSRWPAFTETEVAELGDTFKAQGYPLSTLVMDMEWHKEGWGHWEFNPELIPDPKRFFALCKSYGLDVTFNDHPLDVRDDDVHFAPYLAQAGPEVVVRTREYNGKHLRMAKVDISNKQQNQAFRNVCHTEFMKLGVDYWWNDGSRGQMSGTCGQLVTNKVFFDESQCNGRRGMLLARYGGLGSHRYGAFFTGDAHSDFYVLRLQCEFNIRAGGVGLSNLSHDIGGFGADSSELTNGPNGMPLINPQRYLRWLQFGVFNPILRFHSAPGCGSRRPFDYDLVLNGACRDALRLRHSLLPYIYTAMRYNHDTGIPLIRGLFLSDAKNHSAYRYDEYYFGHSLLVAPVLSEENSRSIYLPPGQWWDLNGMTMHPGDREITRAVALEEIPVYVRAGSIIPRQSPDSDPHAVHIAELQLDIYTGASAEADLYEDDGNSTGYTTGVFLRSRFTYRQTGKTLHLTGEVVAGAVAGATGSSTRSMTLHLHHEQRIASARMGSQVLRIEVLANGAQMITIPSLPTGQSWLVELTAE